MNRFHLLFLLTLVAKVSICQESTKDKVKPIVLSYLKTFPQNKGCEIKNLDITTVSLIDEKEKNTYYYNFYKSFRLNQIEQIEQIKFSTERIMLRGEYVERQIFNEEIKKIKGVLKTTVPLIDSLWTLEEKYKTAQSNGNSNEYFLATFNYTCVIDSYEIKKQGYEMILNKDLKVLLYNSMK